MPMQKSNLTEKPEGKSKKPRRLTLRERVFVDKAVETLNLTKAAEIAYPDQKHPEIYAGEVIKRPEIKRAIEKSMERVGLTTTHAATRLKQIIDKPRKMDGNSVAALGLAGRWAGWDAPDVHFTPPDLPKDPDEIDMMLIRIRKRQKGVAK